MNRSKIRKAARRYAFAGVATVLYACSAQVDSDYKGEPLATLHGSIASKQALSVDTQVSAAIIWQLEDNESEDHRWKMVGDRTVVRGSFPASFTLDLYTAPPAKAQWTIEHDFPPDSSAPLVKGGTPVGIWTGALAAIRSDASDDELRNADVLGVDVEHVITYLDHDIEAFDPAAPPDAAKAISRMYDEE